MNDLRAIIYAWNEWIVIPACAVAATFIHLRYRKLSSLLMTIGLWISLVGYVIRKVVGQESLWIFFAIAAGFTGATLAIGGSIWFLLKDYQKDQKSQQI